MLTSMIPFYNNDKEMKRTTNSWFDDPFFRTFFEPADFGAATVMRVDVQDKADAYLMEVELPGVKQEDIDLSLDDGVLTIKADMNVQSKEERKNYIFRERRTGHFERRFNMEGIDEAKITADFKDGVLSVNLPKIVPEKVETKRKIMIGSAVEEE